MTIYDNASRPHATMPSGEELDIPLYRAAGVVATYNRGGSGERNGIEPIGKAHHSLAESLPAGTILYLAATAAQPIAPAADDEQCRKTCNICQDEVGNPWPCVKAKVAARAAAPSQVSAPTDEWAALTVWYGDMPESNGKSNFTAILMRKDGDKWDNMTDGITIDRSEYPDRVRYEADRMRYLIGEISERPDILAYDDKKHSGYAARAAAPVSGQGASIDTPQFRLLLSGLTIAHHADPYGDEFLKAMERVIAYIDSRPRSEDSRAAEALRKLYADLDAMKRTIFNRPGTGQNYSYLVCEDVQAYAEQAIRALAAPTGESLPVQGVPSMRDLVDITTGVMAEWNMLDNYDEHETEKFCEQLERVLTKAAPTGARK